MYKLIITLLFTFGFISMAQANNQYWASHLGASPSFQKNDVYKPETYQTDYGRIKIQATESNSQPTTNIFGKNLAENPQYKENAGASVEVQIPLN